MVVAILTITSTVKIQKFNWISPNLSAAEAADRSHCDLLDFWSRRTGEECFSHSPCNKSPIPRIQHHAWC